ncbi:molybdopterin molybdotransferase MoeA [Thermodesulforhabdus norvegica]|uniref:Molybdopterin molybdenumtransferase n=1 Tax=Thermodesulforhabdus norvegica TaxID=39841 RepID=A0A1I4SBC3_9BACT|nr:molybdopterin molybdotransferase MoeA [Thermodesulforhabdus norvegica]SFM61787.1 molybdopterin molybdotransferase [Thermodesulforhabdus norvegica]
MDFYKALSTVKSFAEELEKEWVSLDRAPGRVCGSTIRASLSVPSSPLSRWDGFAVGSIDTATASVSRPVALEIVQSEPITAGSYTEPEVAPGRCAKIMTGGLIPPGCDAVVRYEDVTEREGRIFVRSPVSAGDGIIKTGQLIRKGQIITRKGTVISPYNLCILAETGAATLPAFRKPRIGILAIGDELLLPGERLDGPKRYAGGQYFLAGLAEKVFGAFVLNLGIVRDSPEEIEKTVKSVKCIDLLVTTGGTGKGTKDHIDALWKTLNVKELFSGLNIKPGKSSRCGIFNDTLWLALPGGAMGGVVIFTEVLNEIAKIWYDRREVLTPRIRVEVSLTPDGNGFEPGSNYLSFLGFVERKDGEFMFRLQDDNIYRSVNAYIIVPPGENIVPGYTTEATLLMSGWD